MKKQLNDDEKYNSTAMNSEKYSKTLEDGEVKVLFIGNSITLHGPLESIGWMNNYGMAASCEKNDYVHLVTRAIEERCGCKANLRVKNYADFERNYRSWQPDAEAMEDVAFEPDYLIFALGENVPNLQPGDELAFREAFDRLVAPFYKGRRFIPRAVVRGVFWRNPEKDEQMAHVASDYSIPFVEAAISVDKAMTALGKFEHSGVQAHPGDAGMAEIARRILEALFPTQSGFEAWIGEKPVPITPIRVSAMMFNQVFPGYQRPMDQTEIAGMLSIEADKPVELCVKPERPFSRAVVRPLSAGVKTSVSNGKIIFTLPDCGQYVLELDDHHSPLEIFVNPVRSFAREKQEANIVFGPGLHEPKVVKIHSHDRIYIDKDAVVFGSFQADGVEDVRISGYGIICGSRSRRDIEHCYRENQDVPIRLIDSKNIVIDGPVVTDASCWCVEAFTCRDIRLSWLKVTGAWRYNTDGIDICNSSNVLIEDCYVHSFDDTVVLKGIPADVKYPVEGITCRRCVAWCGWGNTLELGYETWAPYYRDILFEDCDLIHNSNNAMSVHLGGPAPIENVIFRNINVEYDAFEKSLILQKEREMKYANAKPHSGCFFALSNGKMFAPNSMYKESGHENEPYGVAKNVLCENIHVIVEEGAPLPSVYAISNDPNTRHGTVHFKDIFFNGKKITGLDVFNNPVIREKELERFILE